MRNRVAAVWMSLVLLLSFVVIVVDLESPVTGITITVDDSGGADFKKIQDAINASSDGDTVFVYNGTYYENVVVNKSVTLKGEDKENTVVNGSEIDDVFRITVDWVNITGFMVTGSGPSWYDAGILLINAKNCRIVNNNVSTNNWNGIQLNYSNYNNITENVVSYTDTGITLYYSDFNEIYDNTIYNCSYSGMIISGSKNNSVSQNSISKNGCGIRVWSSSNNSIFSNSVSYSNDEMSMKGVGISISWGSGNKIYNNTVFHNYNFDFFSGFGIKITSSSNNSVFKNIVYSNLFSGIGLDSAYYNHVYNNDVKDHTYCIHLSGGGYNNISLNILWQNSYPIALFESHNNTIFKNYIFSSAGGIYLYQSTFNTIKSHGIGGFIVIIHLESSSHNYVIDNVFSGGYGISLWPDSCNNTISNNNFINNPSNGIYIGSNSNNNTINSNMIDGNAYGIKIYSSYGNIVSKNNIKNNENEGIYLEYADKNIVSNNNISLNLNYGIYIEYSDENLIAHNNISSNSDRGIYLDHSNENEIFDNNITDGYYGIYLDYSDKNEIFNNNITYHRNRGIVMGDSDQNIIVNNFFSDNDEGIRIYSSILNIVRANIFIKNDIGIVISSWSLWNTIYHNCFFESYSYHAYDFSNDDNYWDNGYPMGGNYWSDFDHPFEGAYDNYQGIDQNIPGNDGIIDNGTIGGGGLNPYMISNDEIDYYPLITPSGNLTFLFRCWNLISIPLIQPDVNLSTVLSPIAGSYDAVHWYDPNDPIDPWKHKQILKSSDLNELESINHSMGFFIHIIKSPGVLFEFLGSPLTHNQFIDLDMGWNLVGYPSINKYNLIDGLNNLEYGVDVNCVQWFDASSRKWYTMGPTDHFIPGRGYWIHSLVESTWEVPL